jgi:hypothetical protein
LALDWKGPRPRGRQRHRGAACIGVRPALKLDRMAKPAPAASQLTSPTPPTIPHDPAQLERAIVLLGYRAKGQGLNRRPRQELIALVGAYPAPTHAASWKRTLKALSEQPDLTPELPEVTPNSRSQLQRAIMLLGTRAKGLELNESTRQELIALVGAYPEPTTAASWKRELKAIQDDEIFASG